MSDIKDTIYIDVDEDITGIIDKVQGSSKKVVALVLPKRASVFQSVVNLKLLKRASEKNSKNIVLITSESSLLPIAGMVGVHVAKTLQSKPMIPSHPNGPLGSESDDNLDMDEAEELDLSESKDVPVGDLAESTGSEIPINTRKPDDIDETIDIADDTLIDDATGSSDKKSKKSKKDKKNKNLKVPNFNKFRKILVFGGLGLVALIVLFFIFGSTFNKATVNISTQTTPVKVNLTFNLDTGAKTINTANSTVPAVSQSSSKSSSQSVPTTGQQNNGNKATGTITISAPCAGISYPTVAAGTGISSGGIIFITQTGVSLKTPAGDPNACKVKGDVAVTAQNGGVNGNLASGSTFSIAGSAYVGFTGSNGSTFTGGTDNMVNIVSQTDINNASQKISTIDTSSVKKALENQLTQAGLVPIEGTFNAGTPTTTAAPTLGSQGNNVTVTEVIPYTMLGVQKNYLNTLVTASVNKQINTSQQSILDNGISSAQYTVLQGNATTAQVNMQDTALVGTTLDVATIKGQIVGKKSGDVESTIKAYPGVNTVTVKFFPSWVNSIPSNQKKITINISKS